MSEKEKLTSEECIEKRLAEMLKEDMDKVPAVHITADQLEGWVKEDNAKRRKRFMKHVGIAAVFVLVCVTVLFAMWPGRTVPVGADKDKETSMVQDGEHVIVDDGSNGKEDAIYQDWDQIRKLKVKERRLCIPEYYPTDVELEQCILEKTKEKLFTATYSFKGKDSNYMYIKQVKTNSTGGHTTLLKDKGEYLETTKGVAILYSDKTQTKASISMVGNNAVTITSVGFKLSEKECKKIIEGIKM